MGVSALGAAGEAGRPTPPNYVRVMVVDDSAMIRGILARWLEDDKSIRVVTTAHNGVEAVRQAQHQRYDVIVLDIEMPEMDGLTALPLLLAAQPGVQILMASTLTLRNADISLKALGLGAADYIPKPQSTGIITNGIDFRRELLDKVRAMGQVARRKRGEPPVDLETRAPEGQPAPASRAAAKPPAGKTVRAQPSKSRPSVLAIGASTGGPQALFGLLSSLPKPFRLPILITQHMPPTFTKILAEHIQRQTGFQAAEAIDGEPIRAGRVYIAPGGLHMRVAGNASQPVISIDDDPPVNFCRPAVDPLFNSAAQVYSSACLAVVLTGMGHDGRDGAAEVVAHGGTVIAQDENSSVVWGMPGAVTQAGLASFVLPLSKMGLTIGTLMEGRCP
ncbi:protein-glutamate methylesterase/protein-glutamine glutaminase [Pedomonas mirosovicensis]|uniref:protein-glutamate methylesterase/protein-glutamine glutaminase n=1 Tax=Pedomonas mirosovicensis TaxID=2908641 RepID=UPI00216A54CB|nr:chemotaxis response regulator protein-glutamate methylesterase [Pedomonas mirosovicensis]MCH8684654.1 chemotaxis response regulator protein-glutamate methylesterase [Pedomonas mirosovicensis]